MQFLVSDCLSDIGSYTSKEQHPAAVVSHLKMLLTL